MPEGPIIAILKEELQPFIGRQVFSASGYTKNMEPSILAGKIIIDIKSWGKHLLICFNDLTVRVHLMLFGSYRINSHTKSSASLHLQFKDNELNFYISNIKLITHPLDGVYDWSADLLSNQWDTEKAIEKLQTKPNMLICDALLDQNIFAGSGNIIKNEVLFRAKVHPLSLCDKIPSKKLKELCSEAVKYSFDFLEWKQEGALRQHFEAYEQEDCPRNHIPFLKADLGKTKRHTFYCNKCQKLYN